MGYLGPQACKGLEVHVERPMVIKPAVPRERSTVFLHNIDQQVFFHVEMLYMYDVSSPEATGDAVDTLREALSKALVPYYFAAGRLRVNEEEGRLELDCNGAGALFAGAYCDSSIAELGDLRVPNPDFRKLLVYPTNVKEIGDLPLFTVQVTRFKCGGVIVGIYTSHVAFDGVSGSQFFHDFARAARGEKITFNPSPDRTSLRARCPPCPSYIHPELMQLPDVPAKLLFNPASYDVTAPPKYSFKTFSFSLPMLNALKEKALKDGSISKCSTFEALTAHLWRARFKAMEEDDPQKIAKLFVAMNFRDKLKNPPLPKNFTGNAVIGAPCVDTTVQELCNEKPFSFCVRKVQEAIGLVSEEYIRSEMDWIDVHKHGIINVPGGMIITPWTKLPFHELDFGWGKPTYVAPPVNDRPEYVLVLSSCKGDGGVDVFMAMDFNKMAKLEKYVKDF